MGDDAYSQIPRITTDDPDAWLDEWMAAAGSVWADATAADHAGLRPGALALYRRAATYYALALERVLHSSEPERQLDIWRRQRACWQRTVDLSPVPGQRLAIAYEDTTLPGFFFSALDASPGERRPLVVINNGLGSPTSQTWARGGSAAGRRGYHWMTFDGPGQQAALYEQGIVCRPDWEAVLGPVLDMLLARPDVDPVQVAIIGLDDGGHLMARALCSERRFAAAVADPGIADLAGFWIDALSAPARLHLGDGDRVAFERELHLAELFSPALTASLRLHGQPYGFDRCSRFDLYRSILAYRGDDELSRVTTPLLIAATEDEPVTPARREDSVFRWLQQQFDLAATRAGGRATGSDPLLTSSPHGSVEVRLDRSHRGPSAASADRHARPRERTPTEGTRTASKTESAELSIVGGRSRGSPARGNRLPRSGGPISSGLASLIANVDEPRRRGGAILAAVRRSRLLRELTGLDRSRLAFAAAVPSAIGYATPLLVGLATGHLAEGVTASAGALIVGFANLGGSETLTPYRNALSRSFDNIAASLRDDAWATPPLPREETLALLKDDPALATVAVEALTVIAVLERLDCTWRDAKSHRSRCSRPSTAPAA
ncbi:MAG: hypothetical protein ACLP01_29695 [Solirubrobacteraceae bacterium]